MMYFKQRSGSEGFTLIELMVVIGIVAILVTLAVPAYQDYTIRAKVAECVNNAAVAKLSISEYRETAGTYPTDAGEAGIGNAATVTAGVSQYCLAFSFPAGGPNAFRVEVDEITVDSGISGAIAPRMTATINPTSGIIDWACSIGTTDAANVKYLPANCRGT